ncbi:uridine kinase [Boudabousia tangfeifanii]|uniref:Uridine kinase n=2 Tax=Boudabousia tangfeifanii TaxID=1912795 RepID=A0A1D9MMC5_9ACTO|nr:uridine kinase [Boudabousia tangfeifanii]
MQKPILVGIAGGTGSGKTTLTKAIANHFKEKITVINHDSYYRSHDDLPLAERAKLNFDDPAAFENELLTKQLEELLAGNSVESPTYDFPTHTRNQETVTLYPTQIIILEGILIFQDEAIRNLCDIKIFVDTDADVRLLRRIKRDIAMRGRTFESVEEQYLTTVKPMHELYVEPSKRHADLIVPEGGDNLVALEMLINRLERSVQ